MKARTLLVAASLTLLGTAPAAWAQYDRPDSGYRQDQGDRYPGPENMRQVAAEAHQISTIAVSLSRQASRNRRPSDRELEAMNRLHELADRAVHFEREVGRYRQDPRHTAEDFRSLVEAFNVSERSLREIDRRSYIDRGMDRLAGFMDQLAPYYGQEARFRSGYGDRDRDRHDRDHDGYRRGDGDRRDNDPNRDGQDNGYRPPVR